MRPVKGEDLSDAEAFRDRDDTCVRGAERQVRVALNELGGSGEVVGPRFTRSNVPTATERRNAASAAGVARVERK